MVLSNKTFSEIKIKYAIGSNFVAECDMKQAEAEANNNLTNVDNSKIENQDYGSLVAAGNSLNANNVNNNFSVNANKNNLKNANPNVKENSNAVRNLDIIDKQNVSSGYENSKKFEDRIPAMNFDNNNNTNNKKALIVDNNFDIGNNTIIASNTGGSSNKIKLTLKTATNSNNNLANLSGFNNSSQNGFLDNSKKDDLNNNNNTNNHNQKAIEGISDEKANELRLTINKLQSKLTEEEKGKQEHMESQRKRDLEFIALVEENDNMRCEIEIFKEQEISVSQEVSKLKADLDDFKQENKELQQKSNLMQQKIETLNSSISSLNETIKELKAKANNSTPSNQPSSTIANNDDVKVIFYICFINLLIFFLREQMNFIKFLFLILK